MGADHAQGLDVERLWPAFDPAWIVHRDEDIIVVDKPAGMACQAATPDQPDDLMTRLRSFLAAERGGGAQEVYLGSHQRLDRDTSGLLLYTLRPEANASLAKQFEGRKVHKRYFAVVSDYRGPEYQTLKHILAPASEGRMEVLSGKSARPEGTKRAGRSGPGGRPSGKPAHSELRVLRRHGARSLLELTLKTGRTHQLRVQLAAEGAPIVGDRMYGRVAAPRMMLHSQCLSLRHPADDRAVSFESPLPPMLERALQADAAQVDGLGFDLVAFRDALESALQLRWGLGHSRRAAEPTTAFRLLHGAAEGAAGVALDVYGDFLVLHLFSDAADAARAAIVGHLSELGFAGIYLKRHPRQKNELPSGQQQELCPSEPVWGSAAPDPLVIQEHGVPYGVRLGNGLRTGIFLDQRDNRRRLAERAQGKRLLNLFAYTGGFSTAALHAGASDALCVDISRVALSRASENAARIGGEARHRSMALDAFEALAMLKRRGQSFDLIVLDPPSYATSRKRRFRLTRDYPELCARCLEVLAPGGALLACVNHHGVTTTQLRRFVRAAAEEAGVELAHLRDIPGQRDFPAEPGQAPLAKQLWALR